MYNTLRNIVLLMLAIVAVCIATAPAQAQDLEVRQLLSEYGWHGVGGQVQVNQPTLRFEAPYVSVWERSARGGRWGDWMYVQVIIDCSQWKQIPYATLDENLNYVRLEDLTGEFPRGTWAEPGTEPYRTMTAVCGLFGYQRPRQGLPAPPVADDGTPHVGGIVKLSDRQPPVKPHIPGVP